MDYIRVPGCVYASLSDNWAGTVVVLHDIASGKWVGYSNEEKNNVIAKLELYTKDAIENIAHPINVLKSYVTKRGMGTFSDSEYNDILQALQKEPFFQTEHSFKTAIRNKINDLAYTKQANSLLLIWKAKTGTADVSAWAQQYLMPVVWVMPACSKIFSVVSALSRNERVDPALLENALTAISGTDFSVLKDKGELDRCFIINVSSEKYYNLLLPHIEELKSKIENSGYRDYSAWNTATVELRKITEQFITTGLKDEVSGSAKKKVSQMSEAQLRAELTRLLELSPEACLFLLNED